MCVIFVIFLFVCLAFLFLAPTPSIIYSTTIERLFLHFCSLELGELGSCVGNVRLQLWKQRQQQWERVSTKW